MAKLEKRIEELERQTAQGSDIEGILRICEMLRISNVWVLKHGRPPADLREFYEMVSWGRDGSDRAELIEGGKND